MNVMKVFCKLDFSYLCLIVTESAMNVFLLLYGFLMMAYLL